jgi:hypothetical protein
MVFGANFLCNQPAIPVVSFVGTNLLQDSNDKHLVTLDNDVSRDAADIVRHDMIHNWKRGYISPHNYFGLFYFHNPILFCVVQDRFQVQSTSMTTFLQNGENDEDMTPMHTSMIGAWNGVEHVQQGCTSRRGGTRLIRFESPRWRPKTIQVRAQFGVQEQCVINGRPDCIRSRILTFYIWLEAQFHTASNGTSLMQKFVLSQQESSKQLDVQNLSRCCVASLMGLRPKLWAPHPRMPSFYTQYPPPWRLEFVLQVSFSYN